MVVCVIALIVFAVMGIFSATHRAVAKEAFECIFNRVQLKPCASGLDRRLKSQVTGKFLKRSPAAGRFVYRHFELISWLFIIITVVSLAYSAFFTFNYFAYGNCEGPQATGMCVYSQIGGTVAGANDGTPVCGPPPSPNGDEIGT